MRASSVFFVVLVTAFVGESFSGRGLPPGSFEPWEFVLFPRGAALLDELSSAVSRGRHLERLQVHLGERDVEFLEPVLAAQRRKQRCLEEDLLRDPEFGGVEVSMGDLVESSRLFPSRRRHRGCAAMVGVELARRWTHGSVLVVVEDDATVRRARERLPETRFRRVRTLKAAAAAKSSSQQQPQQRPRRQRRRRRQLVDDDDDDNDDEALCFPSPPSSSSSADAAAASRVPKPTHLVVVVDATTETGAVSQLQTLVAKLRGVDAAIVLVNPDLRVPHPLAPGRTVPPMLLSDFTTVYVADADAITTPDHSRGMSLSMRWPGSYRLFERRDDSYAFVASVPRRPSEAQLWAVFRAATDNALDDDDDDDFPAFQPPPR